MILKNLMEEKQLDFNQPLLSVRRFSSTVSKAEPDNKRKTQNALCKLPPLPNYKSELKSGPIRNPGTVPFVWERSPGRPKNERKSPTMALEQPPIFPKLPPGRKLNAERQALNNCYETTAASRSEPKSTLLGSQSVPSLDKNVIEEVSSREGMEEAEVSGPDDDNESTYVDALDTLSRSESFFLNCSISGVSGLDGSEMKSYGAFSTDPQTRDFMMGRFLPAAKAMASETPPYFTRKQPVAQVQPRLIKEMERVEKCHPLNVCRRQNDMPHCSQCNGTEETEEEEGDDYDEPDNASLKVCGLFPRLCLQNSFFLLNPVPGMRKENQVPSYSLHMPKVSSLYASRGNRIVNEHDKDAVNKQRSVDTFRAKGTHDDGNVLQSESDKIACRNHNQKLNGSPLYRQFQGNGASPYHEKFSQSDADKEKGFLVIPEKYNNFQASGFDAHAKGGKNFRDLLEKERNEWESASSSVVEKTLYIDTAQMAKPQISNSSSSDTDGQIDCRGDDASKNGGIEENASVDSSLQNIKHTNALSEKMNVLSESLDPTYSNRSVHDVQVASMDGSRRDRDLMAISVASVSPTMDGNGKIGLETQLSKISSNLESCNGLIQDPIKLTREKVADNGKIELKSQLYTELSDQRTRNECYSMRPVPPPLPKSPSESWLRRTLPAVSSKHTWLRSSPHRNVYPIVQTSKVHSPDLKWETMVKTSNVQHGHLPEELLTPVPEV